MVSAADRDQLLKAVQLSKRQVSGILPPEQVELAIRLLKELNSRLPKPDRNLLAASLAEIRAAGTIGSTTRTRLSDLVGQGRPVR